MAEQLAGALKLRLFLQRPFMRKIYQRQEYIQIGTFALLTTSNPLRECDDILVVYRVCQNAVSIGNIEWDNVWNLYHDITFLVLRQKALRNENEQETNKLNGWCFIQQAFGTHSFRKICKSCRNGKQENKLSKKKGEAVDEFDNFVYWIFSNVKSS